MKSHLLIVLTVSAQRTQDTCFVSSCGWTALRDRLPLRWPTSPNTPPSPKPRYCSHWDYRGYADLADPATREQLSDFDLLLRLVDFTDLRPVLAERLGWVSAREYEPFALLSLFLLNGWELANHWMRSETLKHLGEDRYADYAERFGFEPGVLPTEVG